MGKHRTGPPTYVIRTSNSGSINLLNFYSTTYQSSHGKEDFVPAKGKHRGTGYESNFRPEVYSSMQMNKNHNRKLGEMMRPATVSLVKQNETRSGKEELPSRTVYCESGFTMKDSKTQPNSKEVTQARLETMSNMRYKPLLRSIMSKKVHHLDNGSMVPATETGTCYKGEPAERMNLRERTFGIRELSGFTHYHPRDPILHLVRHPFDEESIGRNSRPTSISAYRVNFRRWPILTGKEHNAEIRKPDGQPGHEQITTNGRLMEQVTTNSLPAINKVTAHHSRLSRPKVANGGTQRRPPTAEGDIKSPVKQPPRLSIVIGRQELSGFSSNNRGHSKTNDDSGFNINEQDSCPQKTVNTSIVSIRRSPRHMETPTFRTTTESTGYTKGTIVHTFGDGLKFSAAKSLPHLHPHAARARKLAYPFYWCRNPQQVPAK